ncbi:hypothetical protein PCASD_26207 [Puccinia coronata f. sp. avenae]|uniref:Uncharacterized protein n=1 Tax=Puccinia coronata f. sp. avenae TaxID=200324 RepID=A0A2N5TN41_9BASI|nr:hypothetical protein PCASD_26207 [Puccinia coronata f. sp. avenae]
MPCSGCGALHWQAEATLDQRDDEVVNFSTCCGKGKVTIPAAEKDTPAFPPLLMELFRGKSQKAINFQTLIRSYNNCLSFTSVGAKIDHSVMGPMGVNVFRMSGSMVHKIPSVTPEDPTNWTFAQIFVVGNHRTLEAQY